MDQLVSYVHGSSVISTDRVDTVGGAGQDTTHWGWGRRSVSATLLLPAVCDDLLQQNRQITISVANSWTSVFRAKWVRWGHLIAFLHPTLFWAKSHCTPLTLGAPLIISSQVYFPLVPPLTAVQETPVSIDQFTQFSLNILLTCPKHPNLFCGLLSKPL